MAMNPDWIVLKNAPPVRRANNERRYEIASDLSRVADFGEAISTTFEELYGDVGRRASFAVSEMVQNYAKDAHGEDASKNVHVMTFDCNDMVYAFISMDPSAPSPDYDPQASYATCEQRNFDLTRNSGRGTYICKELADIILWEGNKRSMTLVFDLASRKAA